MCGGTCEAEDSSTGDYCGRMQYERSLTSGRRSYEDTVRLSSSWVTPLAAMNTVFGRSSGFCPRRRKPPGRGGWRRSRGTAPAPVSPEGLYRLFFPDPRRSSGCSRLFRPSYRGYTSWFFQSPPCPGQQWTGASGKGSLSSGFGKTRTGSAKEPGYVLHSFSFYPSDEKNAAEQSKQ